MDTKAKKPALWSGERFAKLKWGVAKEYEKKGVSPKKAKEIGGAVAAKAWMARYGKAKMQKMAKAGKKKTITKK